MQRVGTIITPNRISFNNVISSSWGGGNYCSSLVHTSNCHLLWRKNCWCWLEEDRTSSSAPMHSSFTPCPWCDGSQGDQPGAEPPAAEPTQLNGEPDKSQSCPAPSSLKARGCHCIAPLAEFLKEKRNETLEEDKAPNGEHCKVFPPSPCSQQLDGLTHEDKRSDPQKG